MSFLMNMPVYSFNIPRIYSAVAEWAAAVMYVSLMPTNRKRWQRILMTVVFLFWQCAWLLLTQDLPLLFWIPSMAAAIAWIYLFLRTMTGERRTICAGTCMSAFLLAEFMASLEWQIEYFGHLQSIPVRAAVAAAAYAAILSLFYFMERPMKKSPYVEMLTRRQVLSILILGIITFLLSNLSFVYANTPFSATLERDVYYVRILVDLCGVVGCYALRRQIVQMNEEKDLVSINAMLRAQYDKYRAYQQNIDMINIKYHDLKHQIAGLRAETDSAKRSAWIDSMEKELETYRPEKQTGNQVLDSMIDAKRVTMQQNRISFTCVANGQLLDFMHVTDICTIFGNALDNAIESVSLLPDPEQRNIHMEVLERKGFVFIEVTNYCDHAVPLGRDGFPLTSKSDRVNHGFGVKSIAYSAKKYGGSTKFGTDGKSFYVRCLIPMQKNPA